MLERESVLLDRIAKQEQQIASLVGEDGRVVKSEKKVSKLESLVEELQVPASCQGLHQ